MHRTIIVIEDHPLDVYFGSSPHLMNVLTNVFLLDFCLACDTQNNKFLLLGSEQ
jgi:hypothetical protein